MKNKSEPSAIDSVRKVVPYGAMGSNCFEQSFRVAEFPPALQQKFGEVMLNHTQKSSERVLETGKKLREVDLAMRATNAKKQKAMAKSDEQLRQSINIMRYRVEVTKARYELQKEGVLSEDIDFALPLAEALAKIS
ncbi:hypothetical protein L917_00968 [Phytophthora nicotianae]|uniref:Uncharacterized protein n=1 Tax=Phytophthora nicotianae TaxID=4792 RepID=W2LYN5_PHYNI|nr:hypothetical protein L917_00968 [Phytophthora nicotianae]